MFTLFFLLFLFFGKKDLMSKLSYAGLFAACDFWDHSAHCHYNSCGLSCIYVATIRSLISSMISFCNILAGAILYELLPNSSRSDLPIPQVPNSMESSRYPGLDKKMVISIQFLVL